MGKEMEKSDIEILKSELKQNIYRKVYLFYGPEEYLIKHYIKEIESFLVKPDFKSLNSIYTEGAIDSNKLIEICQTYPVFSEKKVVVAKNTGLFKSKAGGGSKQTDTNLISFLGSGFEHTCLIFFEEEVDKRLKLVEAVKKNGLIVEFPFQKPADLAKWVIKVMASYKKVMDVKTASYLVDNCEQGMTEIHSEVEKLVLYVGDRKNITIRDIDEICVKSVKVRIFDLTDAISDKNTDKAMQILDDMITIKEPVPKILYMMTRHFRQVLTMKLLKKQGATDAEASAKMGISKYAAKYVIKQAEGFTVEKLKAAIERCLEYDVSIKTGKINDRLAAELIISEFAR